MAQSSGVSESDLLRRCAGGDEEAFTLLYCRFQAPVYRFALQMSGSKAIAEEVTQEVFIALISAAPRADAERPLIAWLLSVARNQVLRNRTRDSRYNSLDDSISEPAAREDQLCNLEQRESLQRLRRAILALPPRYRGVVILCELEEMSYEQAAQALDCAVGTVRSRLHRARTLLAGRMRSGMRCPA